MNQVVNEVFGFVLVIFVMGIGLDFLFRSNPRIHGAYRRSVRRLGTFCSRQLSRFLRWAWREYSQFIVGSVATLALLYLTGHLH